MAKAALKAHRKPWTGENLKELRRMVRANRSAAQIAKAMKRTEAAIRFKAHTTGISLRVRA
jgi:hypothetical protein